MPRRSRVPSPGQVMYAGSVAVLMSELLKITSCLGLIAREEGGPRKMLSEVRSEVPWLHGERGTPRPLRTLLDIGLCSCFSASKSVLRAP